MAIWFRRIIGLAKFKQAKPDAGDLYGPDEVEHIQQQLLAAGRAADIPVAVIENGTRPEQRVFTGQLSQLANLVAEHQVQSPALLIIGEVVALQQKLNWFGDRPDQQAQQPLTNRI